MSMFLFFKQKTAYDVRISDWRSDVCSSDLQDIAAAQRLPVDGVRLAAGRETGDELAEHLTEAFRDPPLLLDLGALDDRDGARHRRDGLDAPGRRADYRVKAHRRVVRFLLSPYARCKRSTAGGHQQC